MAVPTITLAGDAVKGYVPDIVRYFPQQSPPSEVRLGRLHPEQPSRAPELADFLDVERMEVRLPERIDWSEKAKASLARVYANDRLGCCVISGKAHHVGVWSAADGPKEIMATDAEIVADYRRICGPGDNGCYIDRVLREFTQNGLTYSGTLRKIDGYVRVTKGDVRLAKAAVWLFGGLTIGFNLPSSWQNSAKWDVTSSRLVGGHDVMIFGYNEEGFLVSSWGRVYLMTYAAYQHQRFVDECYALLSKDWYNDDRIAPSRLNVERLQKALADLGAGREPDEPDDPVDPPPPPKPGNVTGEVHLHYGQGEHSHCVQRATFSVTVPLPKGEQTPQKAINWLAALMALMQLFVLIRTRAEPGAIVEAIRALVAALGLEFPWLAGANDRQQRPAGFAEGGREGE